MSRTVQICTISMDLRITGKQSMQEAFQEIEGKLAQGALDQADLFLLPEACLTGLATERLCDKKYYLSPGDDIYKQFSKLAKKYHAYIAVAVLTLRDGERYNSVLCFDRVGEVVHTYDKAYLTPPEYEAGIVPGTPTPDCFEADFGKIAFAICFDLNFRKLFENYYCKEMEILLFPSYFPGGRILSNIAFDFSCFAVSSHAQGDESVFIDNFGREIARAGMFSQALTRAINLNSIVLPIGSNIDKIPLIKKEYGSDAFEVEIYRPEGKMILRLVCDKITIPHLIKEFGIITQTEFFQKRNLC